jgi:hypothetical protein
MKAFVKLQCDILDRFETREELLLYVCLLCLMDYRGRIGLDYDALAARIHWESDELINVMALLMRPNPESKCKKFGGACVTYIDPKRPQLGFLIPAAASHRKRSAYTPRRKAQMAEASRRYRAKTQERHHPSSSVITPSSCVIQKSSAVTRERHHPSSHRHHASSRVIQKSSAIESKSTEKDNKKIVESTVVPTLSGNTSVPHQDSSASKPQESVVVPRKKKPGPDNFGYTPQGGSGVDYYALPDSIENPHLAMAVICADVYQDALRPNQVAQDSWQKLVQLLPISKDQIQEIGFYVHLNLEPKQRPGIRYLIDNWADFASRAAAAMQ